ncbi:RCC1 domain-containing protein [Jidongwangia harbinensis]|uniref:RCC1 domain-containing protein n=1 Tax=Jidongwangia harbinensis TaxID=2878561 RepID=UPI001CD98123|nr:hypothetical protein [Jidongwangia harbinensis]MCA2217791.1 hypothetical protein [Jidongwangia harbinensis]
MRTNLRRWRRRAALAAVVAVLAPLIAAPAAAGPDDSGTIAGADRTRQALARVAEVLRRPGATADSEMALGLGSGLAVGAGHTCAIVLYAHLWCWGANDRAQLGVGGVTAAPGPVRTSATGRLRDKVFLGVAAGREHTCAVAFDPGGFGAYCWGGNDDGQIGDGGTARRTRPVEVAADVVAVAAGDAHTCALSLELTVSCWGANDVGQLGVGVTGASDPTPQEVPGLTDVVALSANENNTCALRSDGGAWCWGSDTHGQLGNGGGASGTAVPTPTAVTTAGIAGGFMQISVGRRHVCALQTSARLSGRAYCWGEDGAGQLGNGTAAPDRSRPGPVAGDRGYVSVSAGGDATCATTATGQGYCWGANPDGQLGTGNPAGHAAPALVDLGGVEVPAPVRLLFGVRRSMVTQIVLGAAHGCAADVVSAVYCTGRNDTGQLGDGTTTDAAALRAVPLGPGPVTGVRARAGDGTLAVRWAAPADPGAAPVEEYVAVASAGTSPSALEDARSCASARTLTCTVDGLRNGRRYTVFVLAAGPGGVSYSMFGQGTPEGGGGGGGLPITGPGASLVAGVLLVLAGAALRLGARRPIRTGPPGAP